MAFADSTASPWFASQTLNSNEARYGLSAAFAKPPSSAVNGEGGVIPSATSPFALTSNGTSSNPSVAVAPGQCVVVNSVGGTYVATLPSSVTVSLDLPLPSGGNTRKDLVCARVIDQEAGDGSGLSNRLRLETVTGTSAASPTTPSAPAGWLALWVVTVTSAGTLTFSDVRSYTRGVGGVRFVQANDTRDGSHTGDLRIFATGKIDFWTGTAWVSIVAPAVWTQTNVAYTYAGNGGSVPTGSVNFGTGGSSFVRYKRQGNDLSMSYMAKWGTPGTQSGGVGNISTVLPNGWQGTSAGDQWVPCHIWVKSGTALLDIAGMALIQAGLEHRLAILLLRRRHRPPTRSPTRSACPGTRSRRSGPAPSPRAVRCTSGPPSLS
jgi:hypothetical protein